MRSILKDWSLSATVAGFVAALVGLTSSAVIVFQAATTTGATTSQSSSWLGSLCLALGLLTLIFSIRFKAPVLIAWSTAGAAMIVTGSQGLTANEVMGAFLFSALLIFLSGVTGLFERLMNRIPIALASALLAGVLLNFSLSSFAAFKTQPVLIGAMFLAYVLGKKFFPRMTMLGVLATGALVAAMLGLLKFEALHLTATEFHFVMPAFSWSSLLNLGAPLFIVTMASQNLTGYTLMRTFGFSTPISPLMTWSGLTNILIAPFGGFALNLAAITAAIGMGPEAHPQKSKRYISGVVAGVIYIFVGFFAGTITVLFAAFPTEMVMSIAGLALLGTIASSLQQALALDDQREAAFITFAVTASGLSLFGISSPFWGLVAGALSQMIFRFRFRN